MIIDTTDKQLVSRRAGDGYIIVLLPQQLMTPQDALTHAAWIVRLVNDDVLWQSTLAAVKVAT